MTALFIIAILILAAYALLYFIVRPRWWRIAWAVCAFISAGFASPYLIHVTPDDYRFVVYIALSLLAIAGVYPLAEKI